MSSTYRELPTVATFAGELPFEIDAGVAQARGELLASAGNVL